MKNYNELLERIESAKHNIGKLYVELNAIEQYAGPLISKAKLEASENKKSISHTIKKLTDELNVAIKEANLLGLSVQMRDCCFFEMKGDKEIHRTTVRASITDQINLGAYQ